MKNIFLFLYLIIFNIAFIYSKTDCDAGYIPAKNGACAPCEAGTYSNVAGANYCNKCIGGYYSGSGSRYCTACPKGTYSLTGSSVCTPCSAGTYSDKDATGSCTRCPAGTYSNVGSPVCY